MTADRTETSTGGARARFGLFLVAFLGFFLIIGAWAVAAPYAGTPDEQDHIIRAAGVDSGQVAPEPVDAVRGSGAFQTVPRGLVGNVMCWAFRPMTSASCDDAPTADRTPVRVATGAGRYHPVYYAVVGVPIKLWPGWSGVLLARLLSSAICAALLAGALVSIYRYSRHRLMMASLVVAVTPMAAHIGGAVNPNGVEIAAGIALFSGAIPLLLGRAQGQTRGVLWLTGISAVLLAMLRATGLLYLPIALLALLVPVRKKQLVTLWRSWAIRWWGIAIGVAAVTAVAWIFVMKTNDLGNFNGRRVTAGQAIMLSLESWKGYLEQMIGVTSWLDTYMTAPAYLLWEFAAAGLLLFGLIFGNWIDRWRMLAVFAGGLLLPAGIQILNANSVGFITQGRYLLPMLVGVVLLAGFVLDERDFDPRRGRTLVRLLMVVLLPIHLICLDYTMVRWQHGLPPIGRIGLGSLNPFAGPWHPVLGSLTPLLASVIGLLIFGYLAWSAPRLSAPDDPDLVASAPQLSQPAAEAPVDAPAPEATLAEAASLPLPA